MFAVCQSQGTRQTFELCRVPRRQAHGKGGRHVTSQVPVFFCRGSALAHGKCFAVCPKNGTWQRTPLPMSECRVRHTAKPLPCAYGALACALPHGKAAVSCSAREVVSVSTLPLIFYLRLKICEMEDTLSCPFLRYHPYECVHMHVFELYVGEDIQHIEHLQGGQADIDYICHYCLI